MFPFRRALGLVFAVAFLGCESIAEPEGRSATAGETGLNASISSSYPTVIPLPTGFQPEGIAVGRGHTFYVGSFPSGAVYRGDLRTGEGTVFVPPAGDRMSLGLSFDRRSNLLFAGGGFTGNGFVYDAETGALVETYSFATPPNGFVNDVVVTRGAAYFTDSFQPVLYRVPLGPAGRLPDPPQVDQLPLSGDFQNVSPCPIFPVPVNANGIDATPNGKDLVLVNLCLGTLYRVDPETGQAKLIDLGGAAVPFGDGILLDGFDLYVSQSFMNQIAVIRLNRRLDAGVLTHVITDPNFRVPSTIAEFGAALYAVNARFDVAPPDQPAPGVDFEVVRVPKK
jgi:sugar lactone lactonase YvrE